MATTYYESLRDLRRVPKLAALIIKGMALAIQRVNADTTRTPEWKRQEIDRIRELTVSHFEQLRAEALAAHDNALKDTARVRKGDASALPADVQVAREIARGAAWARVEKLLDAGMPVEQVIARATSDNDLTLLDAIRSDYPTRLLSSIDGRYGQEAEARAEREAERVLAAIDDAAYPLLGAGQKQAIDAQREVAAGWPSVLTTLGLLEEGLEPAGRMPNVLLGWERGSTFLLADITAVDAE